MGVTNLKIVKTIGQALHFSGLYELWNHMFRWVGCLHCKSSKRCKVAVPIFTDHYFTCVIGVRGLFVSSLVFLLYLSLYIISRYLNSEKSFIGMPQSSVVENHNFPFLREQTVFSLSPVYR